MQNVPKIFSRKYFVKTSCITVVLLLSYLGVQTEPSRPSQRAYRSSVFNVASEETPTLLVEDTTTTSTTVVEETTTVPEVTTIPEVTSTTNTTIARTTTTSAVVVNYSSDGPPHNTTTLVGCISYYESRWGEDPNVFQFTQGTWEHYGGRGSPSLASYSTQEAIFWVAWEDDGPHHWAAQKGRCF